MEPCRGPMGVRSNPVRLLQKSNGTLYGSYRNPMEPCRGPIGILWNPVGVLWEPYRTLYGSLYAPRGLSLIHI
eukprot:4987508-Pyramimonas_sp.AAC.1